MFFATFPRQSSSQQLCTTAGRAAKQLQGKAGHSSHLEKVIAWYERNLNGTGGRYSSVYHLSSPSQATQGWNCRKGQGQHSQGTELSSLQFSGHEQCHGLLKMRETTPLSQFFVARRTYNVTLMWQIWSQKHQPRVAQRHKSKTYLGFKC